MTLLIVANVLATMIATFYNPVTFVKLTAPRVTHLLINARGRQPLLPIAVLVKTTVTLLYGLLYSLPSSNKVIPLGTIAPLFNTPIVVCVLMEEQ